MPHVPHPLERYREPGILFGGGLLAGLLLFAIWLAMQPSSKAPPPAAASTTPADTSKPGRAGESVLGDMEPRAARPAIDLEQARAESGLEAQADATDEIASQDGDVAPVLSDEDAIAGGLLSDSAPAPLRTWYVEVMRGPGVSEILEIEASSPEHALSILRDFRGDPRIVRGPTREPFE